MTGNKKNKIDWAKGRHREMLEWQRRQMWQEDDIERHAGWMDLRPGMVTVDIGCGLGFLGYTYWKYFGKGGRYIGIDLSSELLKDGSEAAKSWAVEGEVKFIAADAYKLPFNDNFADWVICQTLMIHLEQPRAALSEMKRITKPGGLITCIEPDNLSPGLVRACSSLPEYDLETQLLLYKVNLIAAKGRIKLGLGDLGVAPLIPHMLGELKIEDIDIRVRDRVPFVEPPYKSSEQQRTIENMKKYLLDDESFKNQAEESKRQFLAGGGDPKEFDRFLELGDKQRKIQMKQIENKEFFICRAYPIYIIKGRKSI
jgi:ubiquinone/menaquinone biosynthesis C-methylase UbiE